MEATLTEILLKAEEETRHRILEQASRMPERIGAVMSHIAESLLDQDFNSGSLRRNLRPSRAVEAEFKRGLGKTIGAFLNGNAEVILGEELLRTVRIELGKVLADVGGQVIDEENLPVAGARVFVIGYPGQGFETGTDGQFLLSTPSADGEEVALRAEKEGYEPAEEYPYAGDRSVCMILRILQ